MKKQSFTLIELIVVLIVIAILVIKSNFTLSNTSLNQAADQVMNHINFTRELALKDNKFQYYPINNSVTELNRTKYWFKQWWQIRFTYYTKDEKTYYFYEIFSDLPYNSTHNFSKVGNLPNKKEAWEKTYAKNPLNKLYLVGKNQENSGDTNFPEISDKKLNLTQSYDIKKIEINGQSVKYSGSIKRFMFDNYGNVYTEEYKGDTADKGDTNPYDKEERKPLTSTATISLCKDENCNKKIDICITPKVGFAYLCN
jgi:type II secretory pathway pseudopilin PulG